MMRKITKQLQTKTLDDDENNKYGKKNNALDDEENNKKFREQSFT